MGGKTFLCGHVTTAVEKQQKGSRGTGYRLCLFIMTALGLSDDLLCYDALLLTPWRGGPTLKPTTALSQLPLHVET